MSDLKSELLKKEPNFEIINNLMKNIDRNSLHDVLTLPICSETRLLCLPHKRDNLTKRQLFKERRIINLLMEDPINQHKLAILERLMPFIDFKKDSFYLDSSPAPTNKGYYSCQYQETLPLHFLHNQLKKGSINEDKLMSLIEKIPEESIPDILNYCDSNTDTILDLALKNKKSSLEFIQFLIQNGAKPNLHSLKSAFKGSLNVKIIKLVYSKIENKENNDKFAEIAKDEFEYKSFSDLLKEKDFFQYMIDEEHLNVSEIQAIAYPDKMLENYENRLDPKDDDLSFLFYMAKKKGYQISELLEAYAKHLTEKYLKQLEPFNYKQEMENINKAKERYTLFFKNAKNNYDDINQVDSETFYKKIDEQVNQLITLEKKNRDNLKEMGEIDLESFNSLMIQINHTVLCMVKNEISQTYNTQVNEQEAVSCANKIVPGIVVTVSVGYERKKTERIEIIQKNIKQIDEEIKRMALDYNEHIQALKMELSVSNISEIQSFKVENMSNEKEQNIKRKIEKRQDYLVRIMNSFKNNSADYPEEAIVYIAQAAYPKAVCIKALKEFDTASNEAAASSSKTSKNKTSALQDLMEKMIKKDDTQAMQPDLINYLTVAMQKRTGLGYWSRHTTTGNALMKVIKKNAGLLCAIWPLIFDGVDAKLSESLIYEKIAENLKYLHSNKKISQHEDVKKIWADHQPKDESELTVFSRFKSR